MARYYEESALLEFVKKYTPTIGGETTMECVERAIRNSPAADVVEVVRCKDCVHYMPLPEQYNYSGKPAMHCAWHSRLVNENGYCDEAWRKKGK